MARSPKLPADANQKAFSIVEELTSRLDKEPTQDTEKTEDTRNPAAVQLGRLGGSKGGKARAARLTPEQRSEIARKAAVKRWGKGDKGDK